MKQAVTGQSNRPHRSAAAHVASRSSTTSVACTDNRPEAIAQRRLADTIHHSPYLIAQRQQLRGMFGEAAQLQAGPEEDELLQGKFAPVQRQAGPEEEELLQGKFASVQRLEEEEPQQGKVEGELPAQLKEDAPRANASTQLSTGNTGLPDNLKSGIESLSGMSMDHVKVHYNSSQPSQLNALAYAQGSDIHLAPGQEQHLPHEAWHVVQQAQGRVQPTMQMKDRVLVNDAPGLEHEADVMGARASQIRHREASTTGIGDERGLAAHSGEGSQVRGEALGAQASPASRTSPAVVQRKIKIEKQDGSQAYLIHTAADVKDYLESQGVHFYFHYARAAEMTDAIECKTVTAVYREPAAAHQLVTLLQQYQFPGGDPNTPDRGAQDFIQKKLIEIYELVRRQAYASLKLDKNLNAEYTDATAEWYAMIDINGLCGGWVEIHKRHPEWIEKVWEAVKSWHPPHGQSSQTTLQSLNDQVKDLPTEAADLLRSAVKFMSLLEPKAGYKLDPTPHANTRDLTGLDEPKRLSGLTKVTVNGSAAGHSAVQHIRQTLPKLPDIHCIAHVETEEHHMSVRVKCTPNSLLLKVVETEKAGIVTCQTWDDVAAILQGGIYLDSGQTSSDKDIEITIYGL